MESEANCGSNELETKTLSNLSWKHNEIELETNTDKEELKHKKLPNTYRYI